MALNYWKIGGQPTSYSPLPSNVMITLSDLYNSNVMVIRFIASSRSGATIRVNTTPTARDFVLTSVRTSYEWVITSTVLLNHVDLIDKNSVGDIIIDSIELVQKPLPKLTINGIDGFLSGKWTLHANAQVVDDETLVLNANGTFQESYLDIPCLPNTVYTLFLPSVLTTNQYVLARENPFVSMGDQSISSSATSKTFTTGASMTKVRVVLGSSTTGTFTFKRPMLNLGSTLTPYSKKTGDTMVMPTPKKNLLNESNIGLYNQLSIVDDGTYLIVNDGLYGGYEFYKIPVVNGKTYTLSFVYKTFDDVGWYDLYDVLTSTSSNFGSNVSLNLISDGLEHTKTVTFTATKTITLKVRLLRENNSGTVYYKKGSIQIEEGVAATPCEPYAVQVDKKPAHSLVSARTGLSFNGVSDYLQLPSMTMDSVEIECSIDSVQLNDTWTVLLDARTGLNNSWVGKGDGIGSSWVSFIVDGIDKTVSKSWNDIPKGQRTKVKVVSNSSFTDNMTFFTGYTLATQNFTKAILYKVTCYLVGQVVAQYDFENPKNIVGNQVLPNAQNLIPSFEDAQWSIHANAKVLGKDVLHLDATASLQISSIKVSGKGNVKYSVGLSSASANRYLQINEYDINNNKIVNGTTIVNSVAFAPFTTNISTTQIEILLFNFNQSTGSFDFIKPQLYQLDGTEGTINGAPVQQKKQPKRSLYAKR